MRNVVCQPRRQAGGERGVLKARRRLGVFRASMRRPLAGSIDRRDLAISAKEAEPDVSARKQRLSDPLVWVVTSLRYWARRVLRFRSWWFPLSKAARTNGMNSAATTWRPGGVGLMSS